MKRAFRAATVVACACSAVYALLVDVPHIRATPRTHAIAGSWQPGFGASVVRVDAMTVFEGELIVAGSFTRTGGVATTNVARWDGQTWRAFETDDDVAVYVLAVLDTALVAAGDFTPADGGPSFRIGQWTGSGWQPLGEDHGAAWEFAIYQGELVAAGSLPNFNHVAVWDGSAWSALGAGMASDVQALAVHDGLLYAALHDDSGDCVFAWDGSAWAPVGQALHGRAGELVAWNGQLVAYGSFLDAAGNVVADMASWDGMTWTLWGENFDDFVWALETTPQGDLIAGGRFTEAGSVQAASVALWDGNAWAPLGDGLDGTVSAFAYFGDALIAGGSFSLSGDALRGAMASWDGSRWSLIDAFQSGQGMSERVHALTFYDGDLVAGGSFFSAGGRRVRSVARWDGASWHDFNGGVQDGLRRTDVRALVEYDGQLVAAGNFRTAGGVAARNIAAWDGAQWQALGAGLDGPVFALELFEGDLIAGGAFTDAGGVVAPHIARWDGAAWSRMGHGFDNDVYALTVHDGSVVAGGLFTAAEGGLQNRLARWTGTAWVDVGSGLGPATICALESHDGDLFAGSCRFWFGQTVDDGVVRWDGLRWQGLGVSGDVFALKSFADELVAGGRNVSAWNGSAWSNLGGGVRDIESGPPRESGVLALAGRGPDLFVGGSFKQAGAHQSYYIAHWKLESTPVAIANLEAHATSEGVRLAWELPREARRDIASVFVQRSAGSNDTYVPRTATGLEPEPAMSYWDEDVEPDRGYAYRIQLVDTRGNVSTSAAVLVRTAGTAHATLAPPLELEGQVHLRFVTAQPHAAVSLDVFDVRGRLIRALDLGRRGPGLHVHVWDRRNTQGLRTARGVYFVRLEAAPLRLTRKFVLVRP